MKFKVHSTNTDGKTIYALIDADGVCRLTCTDEYQEFKDWVAAGNQPLPADAPAATTIGAAQ